jgi:hypothetical protein
MLPARFKIYMSGPTQITVERNDKPFTFDLGSTTEQEFRDGFREWYVHGEKIQKAMGFLNDSVREFFLTGYTPDEWDDLFGEEEEDEPVFHQCCGCSCHVCTNGHQAGNHTKECTDRIGPPEVSELGLNETGPRRVH